MDPSQVIKQILAAAGISASQVPADMDLSPLNILRSILILVLAYVVARVVRSFLARAFRSANLDPRAVQILLPLVFYGILALGVMWVLGGFGLSIVVVGIAAGFALKDIIENFAAGLLILATRPFQAGDWIVVSGNEGRVVEVGWRGTFIDALDGRRFIVPNSDIVTNVVTNNSISPQLRSTIALSVDLDSDLAQVDRWILEALQGIEGISRNPAPAVMLDSLTGNAMNLSVQIWITDPVNRQRAVVSAALRALKEALPEHDIDIRPATSVVMSRDDKKRA